MSIKKRGQTYHYDFTFDGIRFRGSCDTNDKKLAQAIEAKARSQILEQTKLGRKPTVTLDAIAAMEWLEGAKDVAMARMIKAQNRVLFDLMGGQKQMHAITDYDVGVLVSRLKERKVKKDRYLSNATTNRYLTRLRSLNSVAAKKGYAASEARISEHMLVEAPTKERILSVKEVECLLAAPPAYLSPPIEFALLTGLRLGNIESLEIRQVNLAAGCVTVVQKGGHMHSVTLLPRADELLRIAIGDRETGFVFLSDAPGHKKQRLGAFRIAWGNKKKAAGIAADFRFHDLRHTFAAWCAVHGMPIALLQKLLGHSKIETTMRYAHYNQEEANKYLHGIFGHKTGTKKKGKSNAA